MVGCSSRESADVGIRSASGVSLETRAGDGDFASQLLTMFKEVFKGQLKNNEGVFKLPTLEIPKFDGTLKKLLFFKGAFESSVHNNSSLDNSQKLRLLQMHTIGKAASIISRFELIDANYSTA